MENWESRLAIVILNYNGSSLVVENVQRLRELSKDIEVVVVDNLSTDNSLEVFKANSVFKEPNTWVVENDKNTGYAAGNNVGIRFVENELKEVDCVAIMNPDVVVDDIDTLRRLYYSLMKDEKIAVITAQTLYNGRLRYPNDFGWKHLTPRYMMFGGTILGRLLAPSIRYHSLDVMDNNVAYIDIAQGCFFMAKMDVLKKVDYFDEHTFLYQEEAILAKKIQKAGYTEAVLIDAYIHHNHRVKEKHLIKKTNKLFDMKCYYSSRKYYIRQYSGKGSFFVNIAVLVLNADYQFKKMMLIFRR